MTRVTCPCGNKALSHDGLCGRCVLVRSQLHYELRWKERYDGRFKKGGKRREKEDEKRRDD